MKIRKFEEHSGIEKMLSVLRKDGDYMKLLYPYRKKDIGKALDEVIQHMEDKGKYDTAKDCFKEQKFSSFMEYFQRHLSDDKSHEIKGAVSEFEVVFPCECDIEATDPIKDASEILRLKETPVKMVEDFKEMGIDIKGFSFLDMKLLRCFYHRIHSPADGEMKTHFIGKENALFGDNAVWVVTLTTDKGPIYMLLIGEMEVQGFDFSKKDGKVSKFDEIGKFTWGSQVVMLFETEKFGAELVSKEERHFVGDGIFKK